MACDLIDVLSNIDYRMIFGDVETSVSDIVWDSRKVTPGDLFIAVIGNGTDGHKYIENALKLGASVIVCDNSQKTVTEEELVRLGEEYDSAIVSIDDTRTGMARIAANMYSHPEKAVTLYGITGTKGKTTSAFMLHRILNRAGIPTGLMGTVCSMMGDVKIPADHTTPEAPVTYKFLGDLSSNGYKDCVMEVSSLGLKLGRNYGMKYKAGCFTNLYHDHIGGIEHPDMEDYFRSKLLIFDSSEFGIINADTDRFDEVMDYASSRCRTITYGIDHDADMRAVDLTHTSRNSVNGTSFILKIGEDGFEVFVPIPGKFNVYNALCALACAHVAGVDMKDACRAVEEVRVPGRFEPVPNKLGINVLVDYAHNGEALANVVATAKEFTQGRVIALFGCGGNRPPERRTEMGRIAGSMADVTVITSDNPRMEEPLAIINDILTAINDTAALYRVIPDRKEAICNTIRFAKEGDTVLIAGKGHEDYQEIKGVKYPFDDHSVAAEYISQLEKERGLT
ncbi:MAG: UDP-N-acetylmuramoyl-L-alanyl-D-glutamate--2,6-diaminopimelate ligase [Clostridiales bacterium]|nr:UDP-N-acetylmuramoyl-L-alanyl-D-glutamate--2,6-diaminopimelate ligase [Clostridiales bacterium]